MKSACIQTIEKKQVRITVKMCSMIGSCSCKGECCPAHTNPKREKQQQGSVPGICDACGGYAEDMVLIEGEWVCRACPSPQET